MRFTPRGQTKQAQSAFKSKTDTNSTWIAPSPTPNSPASGKALSMSNSSEAPSVVTRSVFITVTAGFPLYGMLNIVTTTSRFAYSVTSPHSDPSSPHVTERP